MSAVFQAETCVNIHFFHSSRKSFPPVDTNDSNLSVEAAIFCCKIRIVLLPFPPHTSHRLQPPNVSVIAPFKSHPSVPFSDWFATHASRIISVLIHSVLQRRHVLSYSKEYNRWVFLAQYLASQKNGN